VVWKVEYTDEFGDWWMDLSEGQQNDTTAVVELLEEDGPSLRFPRSSGIEGSRHEHMRELRVQSSGNPVRIFYAFDPRRVAILLIGGDKTGSNRFYDEYIPVADRLYDEHIEQISKEGLIK
jgi:hypothetical protein